MTLDPQPVKKDRLAAARIVAIYAFFSALWIFLSDALLGLLIRDPDVMVRYSVVKGFAFIAVTVGLLYLLIARYIGQSRQAEEALQSLNEVLEARVAERTWELDRRNKELQRTYLDLEEQTARRVGAVEELRQRDQLLIQQSRMAAVGEMLSNISHHWRQPLNVLGLLVQEIGICCSHGCSQDLLGLNVAKAMEVLQQLSRTIDDFRDFSTPDRERTRFRVNEAALKTISLVEESFRQAGITIEVSSSGEAQINGYPNEFSQVLLSILMNSRDAFFERRVARARITVRSREESGRAVVTITDNAGGVNEELLHKIFDAYFTTKELGKGTGVGLFMAKHIIEKNMAGRLSVHNLDGGAEFRIEV